MKKRKDGRYRASKTINGKTVVAYGSSPDEAREKLRAKLQKSEEAKTFKEIADAWVDAKWETFAYGTRNCYRSSLERAVEAFGDLPNDEVTPQDIQILLERMREQKYSQKAVKTQKTVVSTIYRYAILHGMAKSNPATVCEIPKGLSKEVREPPAEDEMEVIKDDRSWLYPQILLWTGCRRGEALALTYEDFDFNEMLVNIDKEIIFESNEPHLVHRTKTEAGKRKVPLLDVLAEQIPKNKKGPLFENTLRTFKTQWSHYCKRLGFEVTPHQFRHAYATMLYDAGVDVKSAQKLLGHSSIKMTQDIYTHIRESRIKDDTRNILNLHIQKKVQKSQTP